MKKYILKKANRLGWIVDDDEVRGCTSNIAKMSIFDYIICKLCFWGGFGIIEAWGEALKNFGIGICQLFLAILITIGYPIFITIQAHNATKRERNDMKKYAVSIDK